MFSKNISRLFSKLQPLPIKTNSLVTPLHYYVSTNAAESLQKATHNNDKNKVRNICNRVYYNQQIDFPKLNDLYFALRRGTLSPTDLSAISDLIKTLKDHKNAMENENPLDSIFKATSSSILDIPMGSLFESENGEMVKALVKYLPMLDDKRINRTQLLKRIVSEFALKNEPFHNLDSLQLFLSSLFQVYPGKRGEFDVQKIFQDSQKLLQHSIENKYLKLDDVQNLAYILYYFDKFSVDLSELSPLLSSFIKNHNSKLDDKGVLLLLNMICRKEELYSKYEEEIKRLITTRLESFDLYNLSQILAEFFKISAHINTSGLHLVEISKIMTEIQDRLENLSNIGYKENRALTDISKFIREFLYDDIALLTDLVETVTNFKNKCDFVTIATLVDAITSCSAQELYSELPGLYYLTYNKSLKAKSWSKGWLAAMKSLWTSMTISQVYPIEFLEVARIVIADNIEEIPYLALKSIIINISDLLLEEDIDVGVKSRMQALSDKLEAKYKSLEEESEVKVLSESYFQQQVESVLQRNHVEYKNEELVGYFHVDIKIAGTNKVIECVGPAHYTIFKKRLKGSTQSRVSLLEKMGNKVLLVNHQEWKNNKMTNMNDSVIMGFVNDYQK